MSVNSIQAAPSFFTSATTTASQIFSGLGQQAKNVANFAIHFFQKVGASLADFASKAWNFCKTYSKEITVLSAGAILGALAISVWNYFSKTEDAPAVQDVTETAPEETAETTETAAPQAEETAAPEETAETTAPQAEETAETTAPQAPEATAAPETTAETAAPQAPEATAAPETTAETAAPQAPEATAAPETTA